jgi:hypothetical protein
MMQKVYRLSLKCGHSDRIHERVTDKELHDLIDGYLRSAQFSRNGSIVFMVEGLGVGKIQRYYGPRLVDPL